MARHAKRKGWVRPKGRNGSLANPILSPFSISVSVVRRLLIDGRGVCANIKYALFASLVAAEEGVGVTPCGLRTASVTAGCILHIFFVSLVTTMAHIFPFPLTHCT